MRFTRLLYLFPTLLVAVFLLGSSSQASTYKVLYAFTGGVDGGGLYGGLARDGAGHLYGLTLGGGAGSGTAFELVPTGGGEWTKTVLYNFCVGYPYCSDGVQANQTLALDSAGNLYGSAKGGPSDAGEVFQLAPGPDGWSFNVILDWGSQDLILDSAGNLYTEAWPGACNGGYILKLKPPPDGGYWIDKDLYDFCPDPPPYWPKGSGPKYGLSWDAQGNLYGVTGAGGKENQGVVFQLEHTPKGWKEHVLHSFHYLNQDAHMPYGGVVVDSAGNVYGSTLQGGSDRCGGPGCGTIYKVSKQPDGHWKETILYRFPKPDDGADPTGTLALDAAGNLYGVAGGRSKECQCGVVYRLTHNPDDTWTYTVLHRFHGTDGALPLAGVILDAKGNLYGTTELGGSGGYGVVFKIVP